MPAATRAGPELLTAGTSAARWSILDKVVAGYAPVVARLKRDVDQVEATVFSSPVAPNRTELLMRREDTDSTAPPPLSAWSPPSNAPPRPRNDVPPPQPYLRDVQDHVLLVNEDVPRSAMCSARS